MKVLRRVQVWVCLDMDIRQGLWRDYSGGGGRWRFRHVLP
jgi:hypothetical protein